MKTRLLLFAAALVAVLACSVIFLRPGGGSPPAPKATSTGAEAPEVVGPAAPIQPAGTGLRLEVVGSTTLYFRQKDGGRVKLERYSVSGSQEFFRATQVIDPFNQATLLGYDSAGRLTSVTEPAGRTLQIAWNAVDWANRPIISGVAASDGQTVAYTYGTFISPGSGYQYTILTRADYSDSSFANYAYQPSNKTGGTGRPLPWKFDDVRTPDVMPSIEYVYKQNSLVYGEVSAEKSGVTGAVVLLRHGHRRADARR
ncbi:MAG: RHS repeat domain-containing protein [Chthoniobacterales bacterium]